MYIQVGLHHLPFDLALKPYFRLVAQVDLNPKVKKNRFLIPA